MANLCVNPRTQGMIMRQIGGKLFPGCNRDGDVSVAIKKKEA
jgi:hypothetical protein